MVEWKNWKTINGNVKEDYHHSEIVDVSTGEVLADTTLFGCWDSYKTYEVEKMNKFINYHKTKIIHRNDVGDCFCSNDWTKISDYEK